MIAYTRLLRGFDLGHCLRTVFLLFAAISEAVQVPLLYNDDPSSASKATAAVESLMSFYNQTSGRWGSDSDPWWGSGNALQAILDFMAKTGSRDYMPEAANTIDIQRAPLDWWPDGGGDFRADSTDDTGWWALANLRMYSLTNDEEYLTISKEDEEYMSKYRDNGTCNGGILWSIRNLSYNNAISNELYLMLTISLHNTIPGDDYYLSRALDEWKWFNQSGMINSEYLINDGLSDNNETCINNNDTTWTYNQGVILGALAELFKATGEEDYLDVARKIADAVIASDLLSPDGILTEPCEADDTCEPNGTAFKGIFVRYLSQLNNVLADTPYTEYLGNQAASVYQFNRNSSDFYGIHWDGPVEEIVVGTQASAVSLLTAVL
ncbi:glycosyl hydrolase [Phlyctema vagabunda]|uniref:Glycosyl hydrolase n=1 Tax=Phlyctema vagabunda TaxID=108571 RepID=A0ABR4P860_9HELO